MKTEPNDKAGEALRDARHLAKSGDYAAALEKHVWFHNNALAVRPSYYGVRLSFALADWVELGRKYPPAMERLMSIRDEKRVRLSTGGTERDLFHDVVSINEYLEEQEKTVELFKKFDTERPEFASQVYDLASSALVRSKEYGLAKKYLWDPVARLAHAKANFESGMEFAKQNGRDAARQAHESIFNDEVVQIITVLRETEDAESAKNIQHDALAILDSPGIRAALER